MLNRNLLFHHTRQAALVLTSSLILDASALRAAPVTGHSNIAGTVSVSADTIMFSPTFISTGDGAMETGSFAGLTGGTIDSPPPGIRTGDYSQAGMLKFTGGLADPVIFDLTYIAPGVGTNANCTSAALGSLCTPTGSPFTLMQLTSNTVVATLQLNGVSYIGSPDTGYSSTVGVFSTTSVVAGSIPQIYQTLVSGGTLNNISFSASFAATPAAETPEPGATGLLALGLVGIGFLTSRKSQRRS
jgi:hypothetical protein